MKIFIGILIIGGLVFLFIFTFLLNKRTPKPEGCEDLEAECEGCKILSCAHNPKNPINNEKDKEKGEQ